jgi:hypothetical protein
VCVCVCVCQIDVIKQEWVVLSVQTAL